MPMGSYRISMTFRRSTVRSSSSRNGGQARSAGPRLALAVYWSLITGGNNASEGIVKGPEVCRAGRARLSDVARRLRSPGRWQADEALQEVLRSGAHGAELPRDCGRTADVPRQRVRTSCEEEGHQEVP